MSYFYIGLTIVFTVYGQLVLKWQLSQTAGLPQEWGSRVVFLLRMLLNPWVITAFAAALVAALAWMAALTELNLSSAYPFMSLSFVLVLMLSGFLFREPITVYKVVGMALIALGLFVSSRSA